jgi:hypothetical protein
MDFRRGWHDSDRQPGHSQFVTNWCAYTVQLKITCSGGSTATSTRFVCFSCGAGGYINHDVGYN